MKRALLPLLLIYAIWLACPISGDIGTGGQVETLLSDPRAGLDGLDNYTVSLNITYTGTLNGQSVDTIDTFLQSEWRQPAAKFTTVDSTTASGEHRIFLTGEVGEARYFREGSDGPCTVDWGPASAPVEFQPALLLPSVGAAQLADEQTIDGIDTRHYTFEAASLDLPEDTTASGEAWIARDGGYVMKYVLEINGGELMFGPGAQGTRRVEYQLSEVNTRPEVVYPAACLPVLTDMPAMEDAADLTRLPGLLDYSTGSTLEDIHAFYVDHLSSQGWEVLSDSGQGSDRVELTFARLDTGVVGFLFVDSEGDARWVTVMILNPESATATTETIPGAQATAQAGNPSVRVSLALSVLLDMVPSQPAPPSFHLEMIHQSPVWRGGTIAQRQEAMSADVQGNYIHYTQRKSPPGGSTTTSEAYLIDDQEYAVVNGQVQLPGEDSMTWTLWPLDLVTMLAASSMGATAAGTEMVEGRTAELYDLNGTGSELSSASGFNLPTQMTSFSGQIWVDQETGALLKVVLDYEANVRDTAGNEKGSGSGHLEITVTQFGNVIVTLPGQ